VPGQTVATFLATLTGVNTVVLTGISSESLLNAAGLGPRVVTGNAGTGDSTLSAASIIGGVINRTAASGDFTDTTPTGAILEAALPLGAYVGMSWELVYRNATAHTATIAAGASGITVSNITSVLTATTARYLVTRTAASTFTFFGLGSGAST
jgi:hypothetical protein